MTDPLQHDIDQARQRAARYWVADGLNEMTSGALLLLIGAYLMLEPQVSVSPVARVVVILGFAVTLLVVSLLTRRLVLHLKDRYVHPRTGYIALSEKKSPAARWFAGGLAGAIGAIVAIAVNQEQLLAWLPAIQGVFFGACYLFAWHKLRLMRFPVEGLCAVVAGLVIVSLHLTEDLATGVLFLVVGLLLAAGGALAFRSYLQTAPEKEDA